MQLPIREMALWVVACGVPALLVLTAADGAAAAELLVGAAQTSITPDKPVALDGQFHLRIARSVENPVTATALAIEARSGGKAVDQALMISCDLVGICPGVQDRLRERLAGKLKGFDLAKLVLSATHTHTAPVTASEWYEIPKEGVMQPGQYVEFLLARLGEVAVRAWEARKPGGVSWALGHAVVGCNRRAVYENGTARMYGHTDTPEFRRFEGYQDHGVDMLFFWGADAKPLAVAINLACPSQEVEGRSAINADYWHDVRVALRKRYSKDLHVVAWCGAAGDQSPHLMYGKAGEERMRAKRGLTRTEEIARRIDQAVQDVFDIAKADVRTDVPLVHKVSRLKLPRRRITEQEAAAAKAQCVQIRGKPRRDPSDPGRLAWHGGVVERFEQQDKQPDYEMELHAIRLGDVAIATNPFELYLDYGVQMKARSKAVQTFVIQLACDSGGYLPTHEAVRGGHYSAQVQSNLVGPEGGKLLVNRTAEAINALWGAQARP